MNENAHVKVWMGGRSVLVPMEDYFEMQAVLHGFEGYDDLRAHGYQVVTPDQVYDEGGNLVSGQADETYAEGETLRDGDFDGGMKWQGLS